MIPRENNRKLASRFNDTGKAHILVGPRQSGKTTLVKMFLEKNRSTVRWLNGDESDVRELLRNPTSVRLKSLLGDAQIVVFDEAQRIENIGVCLKLLIDGYPELSIIATGSSSFDLANRINEPLTGRKWEYTVFPLSYREMADFSGALEERRMLHHRLIYGSYPEVVTSPGKEAAILKHLTDSVLYKDIFTWERIQKPDRLERLVMALALQAGGEVSYNELSQIAGLDHQTVEKYINLLEKIYVLFRLYSFSRNVRNELKKSRKVYFYDLGIRNAVINNFNDPLLRGDIGRLWENYCIVERIKHNEARDRYVNRYFWRTTAQQEIDYIEEYGGNLHAYEFKWNPAKKGRFSTTFLKAYPGSETATITPGNYETFIS